MAFGGYLESFRRGEAQQRGGQRGGVRGRRPSPQLPDFAFPSTPPRTSFEPTRVPYRLGTTEAEVVQARREGAATRGGRLSPNIARQAQFEGVRGDLPEPTGNFFEAVALATPAQTVIGAQQLFPFLRGEGYETFKRLREEGVDIGNAIARAYQAQDLPSARVNLLPGEGIPLPFGKRLNEIDLGVKGAIEIAAQPDVIIPGLFVAGKVARGAGVAARAGARREAENLAALGGRYAARELPTVKKFVGLIDNAKPTRASTEVAKSAELSKRAARIDNILKNTPDIRDALRKSRAARAGELPRGDFESILGKLADDELDELLVIARDSPDLLPFERVRAMSLLDPSDPASIVNGKLPTLGEIGLMEQVFGEEVASAFLKKVPVSTGAKFRDTLMEVLNAPRTTFSSIDLSAPGRQAAPALAANPKKAVGAFGAQLRAWNSEKAAILVNREITRHPDSELLQRAGVFIADVTTPRSGARLRFNAKTGKVVESSTLAAREEAFISSLPQKLPVIGRAIRASERAYITYLNKLRADIFYDTVKQWRAASKPLTDDSLQQLGSLINNLTGRGSLDFGRFITLESSRPLLSAVFFSPGLQASRLQLADSLIRGVLFGAGDPQVRHMLYKNVASGLMLGNSILMAAKAAGADIETDPRSTDFGRAKIGNTRLDFWGGMQPYARFAAQLWTEETKTSRGEVLSLPEDFGTTRGEQLLRFGRSKLAPGAGIIVDALAGETYLGEDPLSPENAANTITPGAIQDLYDAIRQQGVAKGIPLGLPAFLGIGVNSYATTADLYDAVASRLPDDEGNVGRSFDQLSRDEQAFVRQDPDIQERIIEIEKDKAPVPVRELRNVVFQQNEEFKTEVEADLLRRINKGLQGIALREAIQDFNRDRYVSSAAIFEPFRERLFSAPSVNKDVLAQEYWTAPLAIAEDGSLDFRARDLIREDVLARAKEQGVDTKYISGTGDGTWRDSLAVNESLNNILLKYDSDMDTLRRYWEIGSDPAYAGLFNQQLWRQYLDGSPAERRSIVANNPVLRGTIRRQSLERESMRERDTAVDAALVRWYEYLPKTVAGRILYKNLYEG